jgi:hypothetical protein
MLAIRRNERHYARVIDLKKVRKIRKLRENYLKQRRAIQRFAEENPKMIESLRRISLIRSQK